MGRPSPQPVSPSLSVTFTSTNGAPSPAAPALPEAKRNVAVTGRRIGKTSMLLIVLTVPALLARHGRPRDGRTDRYRPKGDRSHGASSGLLRPTCTDT